MVSFSSGLLTAIIKVKATSALSGILFSPVSVKSRLFFSRKSRNKNAAMRLLPSTNEWFLVTKYSKLAAFSSILGYKSLPSNV